MSNEEIKRDVQDMLDKLAAAGYAAPDKVRYYNRPSCTNATATDCGRKASARYIITINLHNFRLRSKETNELTVVHELAHIETYRMVAACCEEIRRLTAEAKRSNGSDTCAIIKFAYGPLFTTLRRMQHHSPAFARKLIELADAVGADWTKHDMGTGRATWHRVRAAEMATRKTVDVDAQHAANYAKGQQIAINF